jgi:hypothetical protein
MEDFRIDADTQFLARNDSWNSVYKKEGFATESQRHRERTDENEERSTVDS